MLNIQSHHLLVVMVLTGLISSLFLCAAAAANTEDFDKGRDRVARILYPSHPAAVATSKYTKALLSSPKIIKIGLVFGGADGAAEPQVRWKADSDDNSARASSGGKQVRSPVAA